jgi:hypothetical protein
MKTKEKIAVLTVSKRFLSYHPRAGEQTHFAQFIRNGQGCSLCSGRNSAIICMDLNCSDPSIQRKLHTVRGSRPYWERAIERKMTLSIRQWSGKPRASKQEKIIDLKHGEWGIQPITMINSHNGLEAFVYGERIDIDTLAKNDGLSRADFEAWFAPEFKHGDIFEGVIVHFTPNFRY